MRIIDTGITKEILNGDNHPQLKIGDKLYTVDNRQSTWDKIQEITNNQELTPNEKNDQIFELALGVKETKEIKDIDLPVENYNYLTFCVMGAISGEDPKELQKMAKENVRKN